MAADEHVQECYGEAMDSIDLIRRLVDISRSHPGVSFSDDGPITVEDIALEQMSGGDVNDAAIVFVRGRTFFAKWNTLPRPRQFAVEADGLQRLQDAAPALRVPTPYAAIDDAVGGGLLLEHFEGGTPVADFDGVLGRGLAELHRTTDARGFGLDTSGYCGSTPLENAWTASWVEFYRERRLRPLIALAQERGMPAADVAALDALLGRLDTLLPEGEPSLIHGDLWSGNQLIAPDGMPALVDPAVCFAHREFELGMMLLFGGFSDRVFDAYHEVFPLDADWRQRVPLYQLFHILNHYHLFGGAYGLQAARTAREFG